MFGRQGVQMVIGRGRLGDLGLALWRIVAARGITSKNSVFEIAKGAGHDVSRQTVYSYFAGRQRVPREFLRALDSQLHFTDQEKAEIAWVVGEEFKKLPMVQEMIRAMYEALDLDQEDGLAVCWYYTWGEKRPSSRGR